MSRKRLISFDNETKISNNFTFEEDTSGKGEHSFVLSREQDVTEILKENRDLYNEWRGEWDCYWCGNTIGDKYSAAATYLGIIVFGLPFAAFNKMAYGILSGMGLPMVGVKVYLLAIIVNFL